jgi:F-type H+-transporting ATPase subunit b
MLIDWFTVAAQAVNFLILVWLLKRFLYAPILNAIDAREKRIAAEIADADKNKAEAQTARDEYMRRNAELEGQRSGLLQKAAEDALAERKRLLDEARSDADTLRSKQQEQLQNEYKALSDEITRRTRAEVFAIAKKTLTDLAGVSLEERMTEVFVRRLQVLDIEKKHALASSRILVRSAFELPQALRTGIEKAIGEFSPAEIGYETVPGLISGIELIAQGHKIAWSVADYLSSLEKEVNALIKVQSAGDSGQK